MRLPFVIILLFYFFNNNAQSHSQIQTVPLSADTDEQTPSITIKWVPDANASKYTIFRKSKSSNTWGAAVGNYSKDSTQYVDKNIQIGQVYEYKVTRTHSNGTASGYGYVLSGIKVHPTYQKGFILLLIDERVASGIIDELTALNIDLTNEGWQTEQIIVSDTLTAVEVKAKIKQAKNNNPSLKSILIIGHVAVPYSGNAAWDGHPDHGGAWSSDTYYADLDGVWTDNGVNVTEPARQENKNVPNDGKFDQSVLPSNIELEIGRVDFYNMPALNKSEIDLLKQYFKKNHAFRTGKIVAQRKGLVNDNFNYPEGFGQSGLKSFSPLFGAENVDILPYRQTLLTESYLWSYGAGGGWYQGAGGISTTQDMAKDSLKTVFTFLFGSYFGDWDAQNNFLRSALASGTILTSAWAGRPHWMVHQMGLGETIGYCSRISQNNSILYLPEGTGARGTHVALMGDPSLVLFPLSPLDDVKADATNAGIQLNWNSDSSADHGYAIFKKKLNEDSYRLVKEFYFDTTYLDNDVDKDSVYQYMVRNIKLESSASGTFFNVSPGKVAMATSISDFPIIASMEYQHDFEFLTAKSTSKFATKQFWILNNSLIGEDTMVHIRMPCRGQSAKLTLIIMKGNKRDSTSTNVNYECSEPQLIFEVIDAKCYGGTGQIKTLVQNGATPYTYLWSHGSTETSIEVPSGQYICKVTSRLNTAITDTFNVRQPDSLWSELIIKHAETDLLGSIIVHPMGGTGEKTIQLIPDAPLNALQTGDYTLVITDANGCTDTTTFSILNFSTTTSDNKMEQLKISPNPTSDYFTFTNFTDESDLSFQLFTVDNKPLSEIFKLETNQSYSVGNISPGIIFVKVFNEHLHKTLKLIKLH